MALKMKATLIGGRHIKRVLREIGKGGHKVDVGFFADARYAEDKEKGIKAQPVAQVAMQNEFGAGKIPERPFFRNAIKSSVPNLRRIIKHYIDPRKMVIDDRLGELLGESLRGEIIREITNLRQPPNAPATIERKFKKHGTKESNPLIDSATMRNSVSYDVDSK